MNSDVKYLYVFGAVAVAILLVACFNFMNIATARSSTRAREVAVRKTLGADRRELVTQFLTESVLYSLVSLGLALVIVHLALPVLGPLLAADSGALSEGVGELSAQRGGLDHVGTQAVVEVGTEASGFHPVREVAVGGGDDLAVKAALARFADALERPRLEHAQQLHLDGAVELPDLVQEDASVRSAAFEPAHAILERTRERAAPVAEELRLDQGRRERRQVEGVEALGVLLREGSRLLVERERSARVRSHGPPAPCPCRTRR